VDESIDLLRSQAASVFGNLSTVVPGVAWATSRRDGRSATAAADREGRGHARVAVPGRRDPIYAALTGLLLYLSSLVAGWADNWFVLHELEGGLAADRRLRLASGAADRHGRRGGCARTCPASPATSRSVSSSG